MALCVVASQGKTGFPFHYHASDDEAAYILSGTGRMRQGVGASTFTDVSAGDFIVWTHGPQCVCCVVAGACTLAASGVVTMRPSATLIARWTTDLRTKS